MPFLFPHLWKIIQIINIPSSVPSSDETSEESFAPRPQVVSSGLDIDSKTLPYDYYFYHLYHY